MAGWFGGNSSKNQRQRQIKSLEQVPNARCIDSHHKAEWRITVTTHSGDRTIYVTLGDDFPNVPPRLRIDSNLQHPFADDHGNIINMPELKYWSASSDVGRLVSSIISVFQSEPPQPKSSIPRNSYKMPPPYGMGNHSYAQIPHTEVIPSQQSLRPSPSLHEKDQTMDLSSLTLSVPKDLATSAISKLTETQMKSFLNDENGMRDFAYEVASGIRDMRTSSQEGLLDTAKKNLKKKQEIDATETEIKKLRTEVAQLTQRFVVLKEKQQKLLQNYAPPRILAEFENALTKVDEQCEEVRKKFQDKELTEQQFVKGYTELRILYHMLGTKKEKFAAFYT